MYLCFLVVALMTVLTFLFQNALVYGATNDTELSLSLKSEDVFLNVGPYSFRQFLHTDIIYNVKQRTNTKR